MVAGDLGGFALAFGPAGASGFWGVGAAGGEVAFRDWSSPARHENRTALPPQPYGVVSFPLSSVDSKEGQG